MQNIIVVTSRYIGAVGTNTDKYTLFSVFVCQNTLSRFNGMRNSKMILFPKIFLLFFSVHASLTSGLQLKEEERLLEYQARNYTWPRDFYNPPTEGWKQIMDRRFAQITDITNSNERYLAYVQTMTAAIVAPNFTETGWALMRAPESLIDELKDYVREEIKKEEERKKASSGVENGVIRPERQIPEIEGARPDFILPRGNLLRRVLHELLPMHEEWIGGVKLKPHTAYGFRLYRNSSRLHMHVDRPDTHIISSILHVDRSENSKPWPILIEDFLGNTNEVYLESGKKCVVSFNGLSFVSFYSFFITYLLIISAKFDLSKQYVTYCFMNLQSAFMDGLSNLILTVTMRDFTHLFFLIIIQ